MVANSSGSTMAEVLSCTCCGNGLLDTPEENVDYGQNSYDTGFGMCRECGGDPEAQDIRKQMGWAATTFYDARIDILQEKLNEKNLAKFNALSYKKKVAIIARMIEKGAMI